MKTSKILVGAALLGIAVLTGCAKVPQDKIDAANLALKEAQEAGAETYVPDDFFILEDSLATALALVERENSKIWFKDFDTPSQKLMDVIAQANGVRVLSENKKQAIKNEITSALTEIKTLLDENKQLIAEAPKGKEGNSALLAIKSELDGIEKSIGETDSLLSNDELISSLEKATAAKEKAYVINTELKSVIAKFKSFKRPI